MYNNLLFYNSEKISSIEILFTKEEFEQIKNFFNWKSIENDYDFIDTHNDSFNNDELDVLKKVFSSIGDIDFKKFDYITWDSTQLPFFILKDEIKKNLCPLQIGAIPTQHWNFSVPINGRQINDEGNKKFIWYNELGVYEYFDSNQNRSLGFYHPLTNKLLFTHLESYDKYLDSFKETKKKLKSIVEMKVKQKYIRVICVYDIVTKDLKYRILNSQFAYFPLLEFITPYDGDDLLIRAYEIDKKIATQYIAYTNEEIEFNFKKNRYFFETLAADDFIYSYNDFIKNLNFKKE